MFPSHGRGVTAALGWSGGGRESRRDCKGARAVTQRCGRLCDLETGYGVPETEAIDTGKLPVLSEGYGLLMTFRGASAS